jgi:hypothetical protein
MLYDQYEVKPLLFEDNGTTVTTAKLILHHPPSSNFYSLDYHNSCHNSLEL